MGGQYADKPLYGLLTDEYFGDLCDWQGPVLIGEDNTVTKIGNYSVPNYNGCYFNGYLLAVNWTAGGVTWTTYNTETWEQAGMSVTFTINSPYTFPQTMTYDPVTKTIYASVVEDSWGYVESQAVLASIDLSNGLDPVRQIAPLEVPMRAMAADKDGTIYAVGYDLALYTVNKFDGTLTHVADLQLPEGEGDPSFSFYYARESAIIDWSTGDLYFSYCDDMQDTYLVRVDKTDGTTELVGDYSYENGSGLSDIFGAMWFDQKAEAVAGTPETVKDFTVTVSGTELIADATFTMPETTTDGETLTGELSWKIVAGTAQLAYGVAVPGSEVSTPVAVEIPGNYNFVLTVSSGDLESAPATAMVFVGPDTPCIEGLPYFVTIGEGMSLILRWNEAIPVNGGNLAEPLTYRIVRYPDEITVAEDATGKQFADNLTSEYLTKYYYEITPRAGEIEGEAVKSREAYAGRYFTLPHEMSFTNSANDDIFSLYELLDANGDGNVWYHHSLYGLSCPGDKENSNDYLCIGPFACSAGSLYSFGFRVSTHGSVNETVAVYAGTDASDVASLRAYTVIPETAITFRDGEYNLAGDFKPETDGIYYFAIHACTPHQSSGIDVASVSVTEAISSTPAAPASVNAVPGADNVIIRFTVPENSICGQPVTVTAANIYRDGCLLCTLTDGLEANTEIEYKDVTATAGMHRYDVKCVNESGEGAPATVNCWAGLDVPGFVPELNIVEDASTPGLLHLTWNNPVAGVHGGYIDPAGLTYKLNWLCYDLNPSTGLIDMGSVNSYDLQLPELNVQSVFGASVYASNVAGEDRTTWNTKSCYVGPALPLPLCESWAGMRSSSGTWAGQSLDDDFEIFESYWETNDGYATGKNVQDGDGGMMLVSTTIDGGAHRLRSPRVDISSAEDPRAVFYYLTTPATSEMYVEILVEDQPALRICDLEITGDGKWIRAELPLSDYRSSKYIQLAFVARSATAALEFAAIDNFRLADYKSHDLEVIEFIAPAKADVNTPVPMKVTVRNNGIGTLDAADYSVYLYKNGTKVAESVGKNVDKDAVVTIDLSDTPLVTDPELSEYYAEIIYAADENISNNCSGVCSVRIIIGNYPRVNDLAADADNGDAVRLSWSDPLEWESFSAPVVETWESYDAFAIDGFGEWSLYDGDGLNTVRLAMSSDGVLEYPNAGAPMAWQVFDPETLGIFMNPWYARSGKQFLVSMQACDEEGTRNGQSNDWLISPELYGGAQLISFFATAPHSSYSPEILDIMVSTTGNAPQDFEMLEQGVEVNYAKDWTEFFFTLPAGTRYFAIVHRTVGRMAVLLDDLRYTPVTTDETSLELYGYNVYRDGMRLNTEPVTENDYIDRDVLAGQSHKYNVTAVWDLGESGLSNTLDVTVTSVDGISTSMSVSACQGAIRVTCDTLCEVTVFNTAGITVADQKIVGSVLIAVPSPGIYLVKCGDKVVKVAVDLR